MHLFLDILLRFHHPNTKNAKIHLFTGNMAHKNPAKSTFSLEKMEIKISNIDVRKRNSNFATERISSILFSTNKKTNM